MLRAFLTVVALVVTCALLFVGMLLFAVGRQRDPELLDPAFRRPALTLLAKAEKASGVGYRFAETARPAWRQDALYQFSKHTGITLTKASSMQSCHVVRSDWAGARAVDIVPAGDSDQRHAFYLYLKKHAARHGLRSGGTFSRKNHTLAPDELGWDPGHLQLRKCNTR